MIEVRLCEEKDLETVKKLLVETSLDPVFNCDNMMVIEESKKIYGVSSYKLTNNDFDAPEATIDILFIDKTQRLNYFGDSLIKATLNLLDLRGIKKAYVKSTDENQEFFQKVSMVREEDYVFSAKLPEFFDTACRSKG